MSNNLGLSGGTPQKQTRFAPIYTGRWSSGLWTNRSPLRDANTNRITEKFYGPAGDALIAGLNTEVTNKLTLARRPGSSVFDSNSYAGVDRFYEFRLFSTTTEQIDLIIDQANAVFSLIGGTKTLLFTKSAGAGQTYFQSVGNTLYFADGVDNKKYLQTLTTWSANTSYGTPTTPFTSTFFIDTNGNIMQLTGTSFPITSTALTAPTPTVGPILTIGSSVTLTTVLAPGDVITFPPTMVATWLENQSSTIVSISGTSMVVTYPLHILQAAGTTVETVNGAALGSGTPTSDTTQPVGGTPTFETVSGVSANIGAVTIDGSVIWTNRGATVENWGLANLNNLPITPIPSLVGGHIDQIAPWTAVTSYGAGSFVVDSNGNVQFTTAGGSSGAAAPQWSTILDQTTTDGTVAWNLVYLGAISSFNGGWQYCVGLVNDLDNTVSNVSSLSKPTGSFSGAEGIFIGAGQGLPTGNGTSSNPTIDPQANYVAIFRTTDGQSTPFLIPGMNGETYTIPLGEYLLNGYNDTTPDTGLNNLIEAPILQENTPPGVGAKNLVLHLNRLFYSIGNVAYWTAGPDTPVGNGLNGTPPLNFASLPSLITRIVPTSAGVLVFSVSDVYIIQGNGTSTSPLQGAVPLLPGIGLASYNALDVNGALIGLFTTDHQFIILDPSSGTSYAGFPLGDQFRQDTGKFPTDWNPSNVYVAWHVEGEDQAWYVADGTFGWFRLMPTPAPETGYTWSPFALVNSPTGIKAVQSVEVSPGVHRLLLGPVATGELLQRDLDVWSDNGNPYAANATIGSCVLAQPGQIATVSFVVMDSVRIGTPMKLGILVNEALPYYTGPIDILSKWVDDPPGLPASKSFYQQRFYLSEMEDQTAVMRHCQIQVIWSPYDVVQNELLACTIFGAYQQEI